jgi:hypothetical protein
MTYIPDPFYNKVIQGVCDFFVVSFIISIFLVSFNIITSSTAAKISCWMFLLFLLVCIYDKSEQSRYRKYLKNERELRR